MRDRSAFELRTPMRQGRASWELHVIQTGEVFSFRAELTGQGGEGRLISEANAQGENPGVLTELMLHDGNGLPAQPDNGVGSLTLVDLARGMIADRVRQGRGTPPGNIPPSGMWKLSTCNASESSG
jgi:hypothetical protein